MTSPLDEISFKLGEVSAGLAILNKNFENQNGQLTALNTSVGEIKTHMQPLADDVKWMKPQVRHYSAIRKRAGWVAGVVVSIAGVFGGAFADWAVKKFL